MHSRYKLKLYWTGWIAEVPDGFTQSFATDLGQNKSRENEENKYHKTHIEFK